MTQNRQQTVTLPKVNIDEINKPQSVHNEHVEDSTEKALAKLREQYGPLDSKNVNKEICNHFGVHLDNKKYSPPELSWNDPLETLKLKAAKRALYRLNRDPDYYKEALKALAYVWTAINDKGSLINRSPEDMMELFIQHLYEIQRGNNLKKIKNKKTQITSEIDNLEDDYPICRNGTKIKLVHTLHGVHPSTEVVMVTVDLMRLKFFALVKEHIIECIKNYINKSDENKQKFYSSNPRSSPWDIPEEIMGEINDPQSIAQVKKIFYDEFVPHFGRNLYFINDYLKSKNPASSWDERYVPQVLIDTFATWEAVEISQQDVASRILSLYDPLPLQYISNLRNNGEDYGVDSKYLDLLSEDFVQLTNTGKLPGTNDGKISGIGCELFFMPLPSSSKLYTKSDRNHLNLYLHDNGRLFYSLDGVMRTELPQELQSLVPKSPFLDASKTSVPAKCEDEELTKLVLRITAKRHHTHPAVTAKEKALAMKLRAGCQSEKPLTKAEKELYMHQMITNAYYLMRQEHFLGKSALADKFEEMINSPKKLGLGVKYGDFFRVPPDVTGIANGPVITKPTLIVDNDNKQKSLSITERQNQYFILESMRLVNKVVINMDATHTQSPQEITGPFKAFLQKNYSNQAYALFNEGDLEKYECPPLHPSKAQKETWARDHLKMQLLLWDLIKRKKLSKPNTGTLLNKHDMQKRIMAFPYTYTCFQLKLHLTHLARSNRTNQTRLEAFIKRIEAIDENPVSERNKYDLLKEEMRKMREFATGLAQDSAPLLFSCFASSNLATALKQFKHQVVDKLDKSLPNKDTNGPALNFFDPSDEQTDKIASTTESEEATEEDDKHLNPSDDDVDTDHSERSYPYAPTKMEV